MKCLWCHDPFAQLIALYMSRLMHAIEEYPAQTVQHDQLHGIATAAHPPRVLIVDAMAVLHGMKKTRNKRELQNTFIELTESKTDGYSEGRVIYDHYLDQSLKAKTRQKRASTSTEFAVYREMKVTMSMKELLSSSKTKHHLTCMFAEG